MSKYRDSVVESVFRDFGLIYEIDLEKDTAKKIWEDQ